MSRLIHNVLVLVMAVMLVGALFATPAAADDIDNIVCEGEPGDVDSTDLGNFVESITTLIVTLAALVAIVGGAGFTLASAAQPTNEEYVEKRNYSILYGGGAIIVLYGANQLVLEVNDELYFGCILPFAP